MRSIVVLHPSFVCPTLQRCCCYLLRPPQEPAHYGPVTAIGAALGRVWTAGGSSAFVCLKEWTQRGEYMASTDLRPVGECRNCPEASKLQVHP